MSDYSEAERRLIESRNQANAAANAAGPSFAPSSVDQLSTPRIDKRPEAKDVDLKGMTTKVNEAAKLQQENAPTVFDTVDKDMPWLKWVTGTLATVGAVYGVSRLLGGGDDNRPPDDNNPPNNRSKSLKDRSFTKTEPTFNSAEATQAAMTAGEPKFVADPVPLAPKPVTDVVNVPAAPATTASIIPTTGQPQQVPVPSEPRAQIQYGETTYNVPTASPNVAIAPPVGTEPAPVEPKTLTAREQRDQYLAETARVKLEDTKAQAAHNEQLRANKLADEAQRAEAKKQTKTASGGVNPEARQMLNSSENARIDKAIIADKKASSPKAVGMPIGDTNVGVASLLPPDNPSVTVVPEASKETPAKTSTSSTVSDVPEGRIPAYPNPKYNKKGADVIGQGGWHFYQGQMGPQAEAEWKKVYGETNQSYDTVLKDIQSGKLKGASVNAKGQGGSFARETTVPSYIKGSASLKGMGTLGATAALLGLAGSEKGQEAMGKAMKAIKDMGISPDIFTNKAEEYGSLGRTYVNAGNPNYKRELVQKLESTKDPEFKKILQEELEKLNSLSGAVPPLKR